MTTTQAQPAELTGRIVRPGDDGYRDASDSCNLLYTNDPAVVVFAQETQDVVNALAWARQNDIPVRVRSGGHCLEGWSTVDNGIVILYLTVRKNLEHKPGGFSLGRFEMPVAVAALIWEAFVLFVLVTPNGNTVPVVIVVGIILAGGVYFGYMFFFHREVLDHEPGIDGAVATATEVTA